MKVKRTWRGGKRDEDPWVDGLPGGESRWGQQHADQSGSCPKAFTAEVPRDPRDMARATLLETQSPVMQDAHPPTTTPRQRGAVGIRG